MTLIATGKKFSCLLAALLLLFSVVTVVSADEGPHPLEKEAGGYKVKLIIEEPIRTGSNKMMIELRNDQGEPIEGATVEVELEVADSHAEVEAEDDHASQEKEEEQKDAHGSSEQTEKEDDHEESAESEDKDEHDKAQSVTFEAGDEPGGYHGTLDMEKSGNWKITIHFEVDHEENKVEFPLEVPPSFSKAGVLAGFLGVNVAVIVGGAVQKRRLAAAKKAALLAKKDGPAKKADVLNTTASDETERNG